MGDANMTYPIERTLKLNDNTLVFTTINGPGEFSLMSFSPKVQELLQTTDIKGVVLRDSRVRTK